jgi:peptidoglycan/LPS O-acetylase OafA/YrhL
VAQDHSSISPVTLLEFDVFGIGWMHHWYLLLFMNAKGFQELSRHYSLRILWSLAVKERFYILWPLAVYLLSETAPAWLAGALAMTAPSFALGSDRIFPYSLGDIYMPLHPSVWILFRNWRPTRAGLASSS